MFCFGVGYPQTRDLIKWVRCSVFSNQPLNITELWIIEMPEAELSTDGRTIIDM
jgi:hypothetical protein